VFSSGSPTALLINRFRDLDSSVALAMPRIHRCQNDSVMAKSVLNDLLRQNFGLYAAALVDAHGRVLVIASYDMPEKEIAGTMARSDWFTTPRSTLKPFYGPLVRVNGRFCLVWSRPLIARNSLGFRSCSKVLVSSVNVAECLKEFSKVYRRPCEVLHKGAAFYHTDDWRGDAAYDEEPFELMGGLEFALRYIDQPLTDSSETDTAVAASVDSARLTAAVEESAGVSIDTAPTVDKSELPVIPVLLAVLFIAGGAVYVVRQKRKPSPADNCEDPPVTDGDKEAVRSRVLSDLYRDIRAQIEKTARPRMEEELRAEMRREAAAAVRTEGMDVLREGIRRDIIEKVKADFREEVRRQVADTEKASVREEARMALLAEEQQRLRTEVGPQLEVEALQLLTRAVHAEVRAAHEKKIIEKALRELEARIRQEVDIRERSIILSQVRESLKEEIRQSVRQREGEIMRREARAAIAQEPGSDAETVPEPVEPATPLIDEATVEAQAARAARLLRTLEKSDVLSSFEKTVSLLREQRQESRYFNMNAAQTGSMIDYLEQLSGRLRIYFNEILAVLRSAGTRDGNDT
jgi:hypothetical protein